MLHIGRPDRDICPIYRRLIKYCSPWNGATGNAQLRHTERGEVVPDAFRNGRPHPVQDTLLKIYLLPTTSCQSARIRSGTPWHALHST
jgi:hypothetical protein